MNVLLNKSLWLNWPLQRQQERRKVCHQAYHRNRFGECLCAVDFVGSKNKRKEIRNCFLFHTKLAPNAAIQQVFTPRVTVSILGTIPYYYPFCLKLDPSTLLKSRVTKPCPRPRIMWAIVAAFLARSISNRENVNEMNEFALYSIIAGWGQDRSRPASWARSTQSESATATTMTMTSTMTRSVMGVVWDPCTLRCRTAIARCQLFGLECSRLPRSPVGIRSGWQCNN